MKVDIKHKNFPVEIMVSFHKIIEFYESKVVDYTTSPFEKAYLKQVLDYVKPYPQLRNGISDLSQLDKYKDITQIVLNDLFPDILSTNEIKAASLPFFDFVFNPTERLLKILSDAGDDFQLKIRDYDEDFFFIMCCALILKNHYGHEIDFSRPVYYDIPDKNGVMKHYRIAYNADFLEIIPTENAVPITSEDLDELLQNTEDISLWKEKFPPYSYIFKGFTIMNLTDVTIDDAISQLKTTLLNQDNNENIVENFQKIFQSIFKINDLRIGFTKFDETNQTLTEFEFLNVPNFLLSEEGNKDCITGFCEESFKTLITDKDYFTITNVANYALLNDNNYLSNVLLENEVKSCILAPVAKGNKLIGVLELVSYRKNELNRINAVKLDEVLPYIVTTLEKSMNSYKNLIKAVIQNECTAIHSSVLWKFEDEAKRFIKESHLQGNSTFKEVVFENVYPLYGQIDIIGSSDIRNKAIQKDLLKQLEIAETIVDKALKDKSLPILEQNKFRISTIKKEIIENFSAASEQQIINFMKEEINPLMNYVNRTSSELEKDISNYHAMLNKDTGIIYDNRKDFDTTISVLNKKVASVLDKKHKEAQKIYPHYFERYKTDGVDHNIYIGQSLVKDQEFDMVYLHNLRLWQLQTMCEAENKFYEAQEKLTAKMDAASLILVFNNTLSIRYRMDEKRFDVDGTYNARYEIIKKRIDKAFIKGTEERITQKGKIVIVYSHKDDEREYKKYIQFLQSKKYLSDQLEVLDLEDLQGVAGLKALRVEVVYNKWDNNRKGYTYKDLMAEVNPKYSDMKK